MGNNNCGCGVVGSIPQRDMEGYDWRFVRRVGASATVTAALVPNASRVAAFVSITSGSGAAPGVSIGQTIDGVEHYFVFLNANTHSSVLLKTSDYGTLITGQVTITNASGDYQVDVWECVRTK